jgi:hypothetical protein
MLYGIENHSQWRRLLIRVIDALAVIGNINKPVPCPIIIHHRQQKGINQQRLVVFQCKELAVGAANAPITQKEGYGGKLRDPRKKKKVYRRK